FLSFLCINAQTWTVFSPDSSLRIEAKQDIISSIASGQKNCYFRVLLNENAVVDWSPLGVKTSDQDFVTDLSFVKQSQSTIDETYPLPSGKRSSYHNNCTELVLTFSNKNDRQVAFYFRAYNEAAAVRSELMGSGSVQVSAEVTGFTFASGSSGWGHKPNDDEATYDQFSVGNSASSYGIPILFKTSNAWALVTEAAVYGDYTGCHFASKTASKNVYQIAYPNGQGAISGSLPWRLPWRVAIVGKTPGPIIESSVVENLNPPCELSDLSWIKSGRSMWSWLSQNTGDMTQQKRYVDYASQMGWELNLIDDGFNRSGVAEVCQYGSQRNVGNELWYNYTEVNTQSKQSSIFQQCRSWGLKSLKIDFIYGGDGINYNNNIMKWYDMSAKSLADNKLMVTYHGCTVPRGQRRRWPNIMTMEGVKGYEWIGQGYPALSHNCMLPFTRNVIGPMDHTPVLLTLGQLTNGSGSTRTSTDAHEVALSVVYESGIQHFADRPEGYSGCIGNNFLKTVPSSWDDIRFIDGYPGQTCILARRKGNDWYVAGISAVAAKTMSIPLSFLKAGSYTVDIYKDTTGSSRYTMTKKTATINQSNPLSLWVNTNGGFCFKIPDSYQKPLKNKEMTIIKNSATMNNPNHSLFVSDGTGNKRSLTGTGNVFTIQGKSLPKGETISRSPAGVFIKVDKKNR
ncbi:MAG TPA: glycoside hydrolase family 97 catalytic domain-containing protein, partial [Chitinispirillaceae bacterium]|nr:glycoside hydrolase family 97 catalytic domain-containing protein [Chitinispirillaceae bacterium]